MNFAACPFSLPPLFSTDNNSIAPPPHCPIPRSPIVPPPDGLRPISQPLAFDPSSAAPSPSIQVHLFFYLTDQKRLIEHHLLEPSILRFQTLQIRWL